MNNKKLQFKINPDAKNVGGKYNHYFVYRSNNLNKPYINAIYRGEKTKDGKYMELVGKFNTDTKKYFLVKLSFFLLNQKFLN